MSVTNHHDFTKLASAWDLAAPLFPMPVGATHPTVPVVYAVLCTPSAHMYVFGPVLWASSVRLWTTPSVTPDNDGPPPPL